MFTQLTSAVVLALALVSTASPVVVRDNLIKLPIARHFNVTGASTLLEIDQARARAIKSGLRPNPDASAFSAINVPVTNVATTYTAAVQVGSPPTTFNLIVDTGSSNTWVGAQSSNPFKSTSTTKSTGETLLLAYGSGIVLGSEVIDQVSFGGIKIPQQSIGTAKLAIGFSGVDGILGIGPTDLTVGTTSGLESIPTVTDNAYSLGLIGSKQVGISFEPTTSVSANNGELSFGGVDTSKYTGTLNTVPLTTTSPASSYVGIDQSVSYGSTVILPLTSGISDTGTTLILLASDAITKYKSATGAVSDSATGLLKITAAQYANLKSLYFTIGGVKYELTPNAQIWPRSLNTAIGGTANSIYLVVGDLGTKSGQGLDFIDGYAFLERYYAVYDAGAKTFSLATTPYTFATTN